MLEGAGAPEEGPEEMEMRTVVGVPLMVEWMTEVTSLGCPGIVETDGSLGIEVDELAPGTLDDCPPVEWVGTTVSVMGQMVVDTGMVCVTTVVVPPLGQLVTSAPQLVTVWKEVEKTVDVLVQVVVTGAVSVD